MSDLPAITEVGGLIPNFWFDLIGRIVPGSYMLFGLFLIGWDVEPLKRTWEYLGRYTTVGPPVAFLLFLLAAYFIGLLLGALGYRSIRNRVLKGRIFSPKDFPENVNTMLKRYGINSDVEYNSRKVRNVRDYCSYFIWDKNPALAVLFSRADAEALAGSAIALASVFLFAFFLLRIFVLCSLHIGNLITIVSLALIFGGGIKQSRHSLCKAIDARLSMYDVISSREPSNTGTTTI